MLFEYGEQKLFYDGEAFPKINKTGAEFIEELYAANILGRKNPMDPFKKTDFGTPISEMAHGIKNWLKWFIG